MAEQVKVYKNVNDVTPSSAQLAGTTALDVEIVTTGASERAVIKDVIFTVEGNGKNRCTPTLDLDGFITNTGTPADLSVDGNLIVGPSSTLKVKANTTENADYAGRFDGMFFGDGTSGQQYMTGPGTGSPTSMTTKTRISSSNYAADDAVAAIPPSGATGGGDGSEIYYYRLYNNQIYKYKNNSSSIQSQWGVGNTTYAITTDGEYLYTPGSQTTTSIWTSKISDHTTGTVSTASSFQGPQSNQGSYFLYHNGYFYSKREGAYDNIWIISKDGSSVVNTPANSNFNVGSYSDGACIVTPATGPRAGVPHIVEQGTNYWSYYDIVNDTVTRGTGATNGSTEYAQGGTEIAPGVAVIFTEQSDQAVKIDLNPATPTWSMSTATTWLAQVANFGNRFGFAGYLSASEEFTYSAFATGIEIT